MRSRSYTLVVALVAGLAAAAAGVVYAHAAPGVAAAGKVVAKYSFDGTPLAAVADESGEGHNLTVVASHGGALRLINHGAGRALAFPAPCRGRGTRKCAHVALRTVSSADLNPGTANLSYGASLILTATRTSKGQNVVQKGYSATSSQYKLQVDGRAGRPSCAVVDNRRPAIQLVRSSVSIADGSWHVVECERLGTVLRIVVDGVTRGVRLIPLTLAISNNEPLAIGGKGAYRDNDQFQGALDDVWVRIG